MLSNCKICRIAKESLVCEVCELSLCKSCVQSATDETFFYSAEKPEILKHSKFCPNCFDELVGPQLLEYNEILERAKQVVYLPKTYRTFVPVLKKAKEKVEVENCEDRNETILRLAFQAAKLGFNAIIQAEVVDRKTKINGYNKCLWSGRALPAKIDEARLELEEYREEVWRRGY